MNKSKMLVTSAQNRILKNKIENITFEKNQLNDKLLQSEDMNLQLTNELTIKCKQLEQLIQNMKYVQLHYQQSQNELKAQLLLAQNQINTFKSENEVLKQQLDELQSILLIQSTQQQGKDIQIAQQNIPQQQSNQNIIIESNQDLHSKQTDSNQTDQSPDLIQIQQPAPLPIKTVKKQTNSISKLKFSQLARTILNMNGNEEQICAKIQKLNDKNKFFHQMANECYGCPSKNEFQNYYKKIYLQALYNGRLTTADQKLIVDEYLKVRQESVQNGQTKINYHIALQIHKQYFLNRDIFIQNIMDIIEKTQDTQ
ncbi:Hypothetical_protein [Hexamita inflata]|uniref:Hypothetical_protein n=1 Tax=Hexamita inflata TaxID=28002 RepID=A0AA86ULV6_9EUKA|nr:Hypothetical protein HINF_LOCUS48239 [Hexamita inflata]